MSSLWIHMDFTICRCSGREGLISEVSLRGQHPGMDLFLASVKRWNGETVSFSHREQTIRSAGFPRSEMNGKNDWFWLVLILSDQTHRICDLKWYMMVISSNAITIFTITHDAWKMQNEKEQVPLVQDVPKNCGPNEWCTKSLQKNDLWSHIPRYLGIPWYLKKLL